MFCARILGDNNSNLPKLVQIMVKVLSAGSSLADAESCAKMKILLNQMQSSLPGQVSHQFYVQDIQLRIVIDLMSEHFGICWITESSFLVAGHARNTDSALTSR